MSGQEKSNIKAGPILTILLIGAVAAIMNQTVLNVAIPTLTEYFDIPTAKAQWLITMYMLVNGIVVPITAFLMARFSTRQLFFTAMIIFSLGTLICGIAPSFIILLAGRIIQAVAAGVVMPLVINVVFQLFPIEKRGTAMGIVGVAIMFAPALGPPLSGYLITEFSWRFIFYAILPFSLIALIAAIFLLKNVSESKPVKLDVLGVITSTFGFGGILYGLGLAGEQGWGSTTVLMALTVGVVSLILFVIRQFKAETPLINLRIFKSLEYSLSIITNFFVFGVTFSAMILVPIYLQDNRGMTAFESGLFLLPGSIAMAIMSPIAGRLFDRYGIKWLGILGTIALVITTAAYTNLTYTSGIIFLAFIYVVRSVGLTFLTMPLMTTGLNSLPAKLHGDGTAMHNTVPPIAGAMGTAIMTTVMVSQSNLFTTNKVKETTESLSSEQLNSISMDGLLHGINTSFLVATIFAVISLISMIVLAIIISKKKNVKAID